MKDTNAKRRGNEQSGMKIDVFAHKHVENEQSDEKIGAFAHKHGENEQSDEKIGAFAHKHGENEQSGVKIGVFAHFYAVFVQERHFPSHPEHYTPARPIFFFRFTLLYL